MCWFFSFVVLRKLTAGSIEMMIFYQFSTDENNLICALPNFFFVLHFILFTFDFHLYVSIISMESRIDNVKLFHLFRSLSLFLLLLQICLHNCSLFLFHSFSMFFSTSFAFAVSFSNFYLCFFVFLLFVLTFFSLFYFSPSLHLSHSHTH